MGFVSFCNEFRRNLKKEIGKVQVLDGESRGPHG
jgi:hypothetical protein